MLFTRTIKGSCPFTMNSGAGTALLLLIYLLSINGRAIQNDHWLNGKRLLVLLAGKQSMTSHQVAFTSYWRQLSKFANKQIT